MHSLLLASLVYWLNSNFYLSLYLLVSLSQPWEGIGPHVVVVHYQNMSHRLACHLLQKLFLLVEWVVDQSSLTDPRGYNSSPSEKQPKRFIPLLHSSSSFSFPSSSLSSSSLLLSLAVFSFLFVHIFPECICTVTTQCQDWLVSSIDASWTWCKHVRWERRVKQTQMGNCWPGQISQLSRTCSGG